MKFVGALSIEVEEPGVADADGVGLLIAGVGVGVAVAVGDGLFVSGVREGVAELFAFVKPALFPDEL